MWPNDEVLAALDEALATLWQADPGCPEHEVLKEWAESLPSLPQPDWDDAPSWAMWATLIAIRTASPIDFRWHYHEAEPQPDGDDGWLVRTDTRRCIGGRTSLSRGIDWRVVKLKRPGAT